MARRLRSWTLVMGLVLASSPRAGAVPPGSADAAGSLALCRTAETLAGAEGDALLTRGLALAEQALDANPGDALGHFALFCNLGRRVQATGLGFTTGFAVFRAIRALDAALALAPDDVDVVTAKGVLLLQLPRLLGGDVARAEEWLRRALAIDPHHTLARRYLAETLARRGAEIEAQALRASY
jgi:tetratricopeptide (TPR) repeat protein